MFIQCPPLQRGQEERESANRDPRRIFEWEIQLFFAEKLFWLCGGKNLEIRLTIWKSIKPCPPAWVLHPPLWMGHKASSQHFIDGAAWSQVQSRRELHFHGSVHRKGVQAKQQMWFIIAQPFCFKGLRGLNVTVYKWELLGEIDQCKAQSDFKGIWVQSFL